MLNQLLSRLKGPVQLPECLRIIGICAINSAVSKNMYRFWMLIFYRIHKTYGSIQRDPTSLKIFAGAGSLLQVPFHKRGEIIHGQRGVYGGIIPLSELNPH